MKGKEDSVYDTRITLLITQLITLLITQLFLFSPRESVAQITQPERFERQQKSSDDYFNIISLEEEGIALFREKDKFRNSNRVWEVIFLGPSLEVIKELEIEIKERHKISGYETAQKHLYLLFRTGETTKNDFELIDLSYAGEEVGRYQIKPDIDFKLTHFTVAGKRFILGGYVNNEPAVLIFDPQQNQLKVVPGFFQKDTELVDLRVNQNQTFNAVLIDRSSRDDRKLIHRTFDETGLQLLEDVVQIEPKHNLQTGVTSMLKHENLVILGTWGEKNTKQSLGFYSLQIDPFSKQKINYYPLGTLDHFLDFQNEKRAERIKSETADDLQNNRIPSYSNYLMPFRLVENENGFLLLAEVYTPLTTNNSYYNNPYYYNPFYSPYGVNPYWPGFGYYYPGISRRYSPYAYSPGMKTNEEVRSVESVVLSFDKTGNLMWDQMIKLDDIKRPGVEQVSDFLVKDDSVYLLYKQESELKVRTASIKGEAVDSTQKIILSDPLDEIRSETDNEGGVRHWYGNTFYVWGYQTIRNINKEERIRDVFYINKVVIQ